MRWSGQIFWLLVFEEVEGFSGRRESDREAFPLRSTSQTLN
jgi:hypothetical protein